MRQDWDMAFTAPIDAVYCIMCLIVMERMVVNGLSLAVCIFCVSHSFCLICFWEVYRVLLGMG
jgi:hypothetical protein